MIKKAFEKELQQSIDGEVYFDEITRHVYSVDASIFEVVPRIVVLPKHLQDLLKIVKISKKYAIPITPRGAATGITGGCLGEGIVVDTSKYLNRILEINYDKEYAVCEPGVVQDRLNDVLEKQGYRLGPETSTGNRATLGGMVANNSAGAHSLLYGKMVDHVEGIELVLSSGDILYCDTKTPASQESLTLRNTPEGDLYRNILRIKNDYREEIEKHFPKLPRRVSGYNLDALIQSDAINLSQLICGSEGTLGIITKIRVKICKRPQCTGLSLLFFDRLMDSFAEVPKLLQYDPISVEMIDHRILEMGKLSPSIKNKLDWLQGTPEAILAIEFSRPTPSELDSALQIFSKDMEQRHIGNRRLILNDEKSIANFWALRKSGLGLLLSKRSYERAIAFVEDVSVAPEKLASFMEKFQACLKAHGKEAGIYGHVGSGCMHLRPYIDLRKPEELKTMKAIMEEVTSLLVAHGGALSGEHGDGYIRSWLNEKLFGKKIYEAFKAVKQAFDPDNRMNPHKIVNGLPPTNHLRSDSETHYLIETFLDFRREGGFELAADLCNGNASCRKAEGLMCPSFQATGEEYHTTRARAQTLRAIIHGQIKPEEFTGQGLHDVLDLCLECKGCKTECPSEVDMAKMKSEFLYHYQKKHGTSLRSRLFASVGVINRLFSPFSALFNRLSQTQFSKYLLNRIGIATQRPLPKLAPKRFSQLSKQRTSIDRLKKQVVLFNDTYNEFNTPNIGTAACHILKTLGYEVLTPPWNCCGRPMISKGLLKQAQKKGVQLIEMLFPYAQEGLSIIFLEPSCLSAIQDDYQGLLGKLEGNLPRQAEKVAQASLSFEDFLYNELYNKNNRLPEALHSPARIVYHSHCHQKALSTTKTTKKVLEAISQATIEEIPSGCCGLAGSFGYEAEHYEISLKIGALKLFPFIHTCSQDTLIIANGTSCRHQISQGTKKQAYHLAEAIVRLLE